jgi:hypothetical protein
LAETTLYVRLQMLLVYAGNGRATETGGIPRLKRLVEVMKAQGAGLDVT